MTVLSTEQPIRHFVTILFRLLNVSSKKQLENTLLFISEEKNNKNKMAHPILPLMSYAFNSSFRKDAQRATLYGSAEIYGTFIICSLHLMRVVEIVFVCGISSSDFMSPYNAINNGQQKCLRLSKGTTHDALFSTFHLILLISRIMCLCDSKNHHTLTKKKKRLFYNSRSNRFSM